jgi:hypothetical protein
MHAVVSHYQNAGQNQYILVANKSFENVADFKYLGTKITNPYRIHKEINSSLNAGNACYHSVQSFVFTFPFED